MQLKLFILCALILPAAALADCPLVGKLRGYEESGIKLDFVKQYAEGLKQASKVQDFTADLENLRKGDACTSEAWRAFFNASIALAPFDQDSENSSSAADAVVADKELAPVLEDAIVKWQAKYLAKDAKNLPQWCKGELFQKVEAGWECDKRKKKDCPEPTFDYVKCAHLPEKGRVPQSEE